MPAAFLYRTRNALHLTARFMPLCSDQEEAMSERASGRDIEDRAFRFACRIVPTAEILIQRGGVAALLGRQLARAGTSIGANLEEATGAHTKRDFIAKTAIAFKEARESLYWLRLIDATITPVPADVSALREESDQLVSILTAILRTARASSKRGV
jgi:four helix bundle protein